MEIADGVFLYTDVMWLCENDGYKKVDEVTKTMKFKYRYLIPDDSDIDAHIFKNTRSRRVSRSPPSPVSLQIRINTADEKVIGDATRAWL